MKKHKERLFIFSWCLAIQASGMLLTYGIIEKNIITLITGIFCFGLFAGLLVTYFFYTTDEIKDSYESKIEELILKYRIRCNVIKEHSIKKYNAKLEGEELIFPFDGDDEDNCMASGYAEEHATLLLVIKKLEELL